MRSPPNATFLMFGPFVPPILAIGSCAEIAGFPPIYGAMVVLINLVRLIETNINLFSVVYIRLIYLSYLALS